MAISHRSTTAAAILGWLILCSVGPSLAYAQIENPSRVKDGDAAVKPDITLPKSPNEPSAQDSASADKLALEQQRIADKYKHLEEVMLQMAELSVKTDPRRAALLKKVVAQSKDQLIAVRIERLIEFLEKDRLSQAVKNQNEIDQDLRALLDMLQSENRAKRIQSEKARVREYLKRLGNILKQEKDVQGRTAQRDDPLQLAGRQGKIAEKTGDLAKDIQINEEGGEKQGDIQATKDEKDQSGKDQSGNPARKRLDAAQKRMEEAKNKLEKAQHDRAAKDQEEALKELESAKAELEQILRQLREEEVQRVLAALEARFRKMLEMQREVYDGTVGLDKVPQPQRSHNHEIQSSRLSAKEMQIVVEVDKVLLILREDGTTAAFAEAADQMRTDMQQVVDRLSQAKVGQVTQTIELDVITTLEEIIDSLKKAQKDREKNQAQKSLMPQIREEDSPLVDKLAELKMIRALQMRINARTERYSKLIDGEQAENAELIEALKRLAERQQRVYRVTRDLSSGKTE
jgi:hypothetical protein